MNLEIFQKLLYLGDKTKLFLSIFYCISICMFLLAGYITNVKYLFYILMIFPASHLFWQIKTLDINNPDDCLKKFQSNKWFGLLILLGIIFGKV